MKLTPEMFKAAKKAQERNSGLEGILQAALDVAVEQTNLKLYASIYALSGYCSATPQAILPTSDVDELLGAWNRWNNQLREHYIPELMKALDETRKGSNQ